MPVIIHNFQSKIIIPKTQIHQLVQFGCKRLKFPKTFELSIVFVGSQRMRRLNRQSLGHDYVTDVITFDYDGGFGEIVICPQVAMINAQTYQHTLNQEIFLYVAHGLLHLAGYDDHTPKDIAQMRYQEQQLLKFFQT